MIEGQGLDFQKSGRINLHESVLPLKPETPTWITDLSTDLKALGAVSPVVPELSHSQQGTEIIKNIGHDLDNMRELHKRESGEWAA